MFPFATLSHPNASIFGSIPRILLSFLFSISIDWSFRFLILADPAGDDVTFWTKRAQTRRTSASHSAMQWFNCDQCVVVRRVKSHLILMRITNYESHVWFSCFQLKSNTDLSAKKVKLLKLNATNDKQSSWLHSLPVVFRRYMHRQILVVPSLECKRAALGEATFIGEYVTKVNIRHPTFIWAFVISHHRKCNPRFPFAQANRRRNHQNRISI